MNEKQLLKKLIGIVEVHHDRAARMHHEYENRKEYYKGEREAYADVWNLLKRELRNAN